MIFSENVKQLIGKANLIAEIAKTEIAEFVDNNRIRISAMQSAGQLSANLAAGALSGVSAQAHISSSDSVNASGSVSYQGQETIYKDMTPLET